MPIYCISTGVDKPLTIDELAVHLKKAVRETPFDSPVWYPDGSAKTAKFLHTAHIYFTNVIPAYITDGILRLLGKKTL